MNQRSQHDGQQDPQDNIDIDVGNDDYDEETDEFANYTPQHAQPLGDGNSGSQSNNMAGPSTESAQSNASGGPQNPQSQMTMSQSIKSNSSKGKKSQQ